jgi:phosphoribosylglycinamide formyltransferase-1
MLAARILEIEHRIYPDALWLVARGLVRLDGDTCKTAGSAGSDATLISPAVASLQPSGRSHGE